jgi:DNA-binding beta-propeller fold protein YncE
VTAGGRQRVLLALLAVSPLVAACEDQGDRRVPGLEFVFGSTGMGPGEFSYPRALARGAEGCFYVVDKAARIQCFTPDGEFKFDWRMPAYKAGKPTGLGVGPDGRIYAADTHYFRVVVFEANGTRVGAFGSQGTGPGQFILPTDVAVTSAGEIYVAEYGGNDRISKFSPDREYLFSFGGPEAGPARLQRPQALHLAGDGTLWVADACNHRICHFSAEGELLGAFGRSGSDLGELRFPYGLDQLSDGTFIVCEYGNNRLQRFTPSGQSLGVWGEAGRRRGQLAYPWAAAVGPDDRILLLDSGNNRVQVLRGRAAVTWRRP